ncbi:hypothetical protein ACED51_17540 [Photobacterium swingsii]|uniref:hypothetical protein n=1 Tax=Photobacterium swingsii TaxID=680026 RepID=UPI00352ED350
MLKRKSEESIPENHAKASKIKQLSMAVNEASSLLKAIHQFIIILTAVMATSLMCIEKIISYFS